MSLLLKVVPRLDSEAVVSGSKSVASIEKGEAGVRYVLTKTGSTTKQILGTQTFELAPDGSKITDIDKGSTVNWVAPKNVVTRLADQIALDQEVLQALFDAGAITAEVDR